MAKKFLTDINIAAGVYDSSGDIGNSGQVLSSTGSGVNWINATSSASVVYQDGFTGDGSTTAFTLANSIDNENKTQVYIDGVYQHKDTFSLSGTTLTFSTAPPSTTDIEVISFSSVSAADDILYDEDFSSAGLMTTNGSGVYSITTNNSSNWNTAHTYSQVGHLPLAGGAITGAITTNSTFDGRDVSVDGTKLDGIEASATADQTDAEIRTAVEAATDSNVFTDADHTKLNAIEASATADQTAAEIRVLVEAATDSNVFTDADHTKLNAIEASADVTDTTNVTAAGALMDSELTDLAGIKAVTISDLATETYVDTAVSDLVDSSPATLNTLNELAAALGDDPNFATTTATSIGLKAPLASPSFTGNAIFGGNVNTSGDVHIDEGSTSAFQTTNKLRFGNSGWNNNIGIESYWMKFGSNQNEGFKFEESNSNMLLQLDGGNNTSGNGALSATFAGAITASGYNDSNWNTAYGWGNHASAGYLTSSSTQSKYVRSDAADTISFAAGSSEMLTFSNTTSGGLIQIGLQQNDSDGLHHRVYLKAWKGSTAASGNLDLIVRGTGGSTTSDVLSLRSGSTNMTWRGHTIWNDGNDGPGSGLNADLLDGLHASSFLQTTGSFGDFTGINSALNTRTGAGVAIGKYASTYAYIDLASTNSTYGSWIDFSKGDGADYGGRIRYHNSNETFTFTTGGSNDEFVIYTTHTHSIGSSRAPIFYDSSNTGYYTYPSNQSVFYRLKLQGTGLAGAATLEIDNPSTSAFIHTGELFTANMTAGQANIFVIGKEGSGKNSGYIGYNYASAGSNNNYVTIGHWSADHLFRVYGDVITSQVSFRGSADVRGTLFYDTNDTSYYVNPASESKISKLWINNGGAGGVPWSSGFNQGSGSNYWNQIQDAGVARQRNFGTGGYDWYSSGGTQLMDLDNNGALFAAASMKAPIFYDSANTAFYVNPPAESNLSELRLNVGGLQLYRAYNNNAIWFAANSDANHVLWNDYYGGPGTRPGGTSFDGIKWNAYRGIHIRGGTGGAYNVIVAQNAASNQNTHTVALYAHNTKQFETVSGGAVANNQMSSPIFYDSLATSYYIDPGSATSVNVAGTVRGNYYVASNYASTGYTVYKGYDNWNHFISVRGHCRPGQSKAQAAILGGHQTSFVEYAENNSTTGWFFIGSAGSTYEEIAKITKDFAQFTQLRAPLFYDSNNTNYYVDPYGTSVINGLTMAGALQTAGSHTVGSSGTSNIYMGGTSGNYFRFHTNNSHTYFDGNVGDIHWRQGASTRFTFYMTSANMTINGSLTQNSDERVKENIVEIPNAIDKVKAMKGVYYNRTDFNTGVTKVGVLAQEVEAVLPELIVEAPDSGLKSVAYGELTAVLINAIKELEARVQELENN